MSMISLSEYHITCPDCGSVFSVDEGKVKSVVDQVRDETTDRIRNEMKEEQDKAVHIAVEAALEKARVKFYQQESKAIEAKAASEKAIAELQHKLDLAEQDKKAAIQEALTEAKAENTRLTTALQHSTEVSDMKVRSQAAEAEKAIRDIEAAHLREKAQMKATAEAEIARRDQQIAALTERAKAAGTEKELAVRTVQDKMIAEIQRKETELLKVKGELESQLHTAKLQENLQKEHYENSLRMMEEEIKRIRDFKAKMSTKALGESLEKFCQDQFNAIRTTAFPGAYFEKDNDSTSGSKGDYIFRESVDGIEILSIMFEMKTDANETATKHKNEDFFAKLDKDRREKGCEYAVLVSTLEAESDFYNAGIQDVSYRYEKMFVVRPQQFIALISLLRNAALNSLQYQKELVLVKSQQLDLTHFEENMEAFKEGFGRNYRLASDKLNAAVAGIDKTIKELQKTRDQLLSSDNQLRLANDKAESLTIRKLTVGAPSVAQKLAAVKKDDPGITPEKAAVVAPETKTQAAAPTGPDTSAQDEKIV